MDLIDFDSSDTVRTPDAKLNKCQSKTIPRVTVTEPLTIEKRSLSDSSLVDIVIESKSEFFFFFQTIWNFFEYIIFTKQS